MTKDTTAKVGQSLRGLRAFHLVGRKSLTKHPGGVGYGEMREEAERLRVSVEALRKARAFASAYTRDDLDAACQLAELHRFPLGTSHVIRLLSVGNQSQRNRLQREMIKHGWSKRRLDAEIRKRFGNRQPSAGRRQPSPETAEDACYAIARLCRQWERLMDALERHPDPVGDGSRPLPPQLPPLLRKRLRHATDAMAAVQARVIVTLDGDPDGRT